MKKKFLLYNFNFDPEREGVKLCKRIWNFLLRDNLGDAFLTHFTVAPDSLLTSSQNVRIKILASIVWGWIFFSSSLFLEAEKTGKPFPDAASALGPPHVTHEILWESFRETHVSAGTNERYWSRDRSNTH
jgi:hypothetical protein